MRESVIYQELLEEARQEILQELKEEVRLVWVRSLILRQLHRQVGEIPESLRQQVEQLPIAQLESLGEALLDFGAIADLETWLQDNP